MSEIKMKIDIKSQQDMTVFRQVPQYQGMVVANRFLLLLVSSLMLIIFILGFVLIPDNDPLGSYSKKIKSNLATIKNPILSTEATQLKGQVVNLLSGSIENKLKTLEESIKMGHVTTSLGTVQELKSDVRTLRAYSDSAGREVKENGAKNQLNIGLIKEVSQLKKLVYFMLVLCGLMVVAVGGFLIRNYYLARSIFPVQHLGGSSE